MSKIIIIGSSKETIKTIEAIRSTDHESEITLLACDGQYPYEPNLFPAYIAKEISREEVFIKSKEFFAKHSVGVILDKPIARINFKKRKVTAEDQAKTPFDFDVLFLTQAFNYRLPDIKGNTKIGIYGLKKFSDVELIIKNIPLVEAIIVQAQEPLDYLTAVALTKKEKEVVVVSSAKDLADAELLPEIVEQINTATASGKLNLIWDNTITEILGDSELKAVRLKSGKVLAAQMVIAGGQQSDLRILADSALKINQRICVDEQSKTNLDAVYAMGDIAELAAVVTV